MFVTAVWAEEVWRGMVGIAVSGDVGVKMVVAKMRLSLLSDLALPMFGGIPRPPDSLVSCL